MRKSGGIVMRRTFFRRLSAILLILMLTTVFSFAGSESPQNPENSTSYGFSPFQADETQLSDLQKKAIEKGITSSSKKNTETLLKSYVGEYGRINKPAVDGCYCLADTMYFDIDVRDTYSSEFTCPVVATFNSNDELVDIIASDEPANLDGWTNYTGSVKLNLSSYTSGTHYFWLINWPCDEYGNLYDVDDLYEDCAWVWVRFYIGPYGKVIIRNTIANSAKRTNDVIWDYQQVKGEDRYEINWRARGASKWASRTVGVTTRGTTSGLTVGNLYEIRVRPKKGGIGGKWSNTVYRYFHTTQRIRLASRSKGSFTMSWQKNPKATSYQVMFSTNKNGAGAAKNINTVSAAATSFTKKGLKSGVTYYVQIREVKTIGGINYIGNISCPVAVKVK